MTTLIPTVKNHDGRVVCHFSCGAASAVATKFALMEYGIENCEVVNIHIKEEHPDNQRFLKECEEWFGTEIKILRNEKYNASIYNVFLQNRYIKGVRGAPCTSHLKRRVRAEYQRPDDLHIFGFTLEEEQRAIDFDERNDLDVDWILIRKKISKSDCLGVLESVGIEIPTMYKLGFNNNNCVGCVKGGMGYWNLVRKHFPENFNKMAQVEREIGHAILKDKNGAVWLDELDPNRGRINDEVDIECSFFCNNALAEFKTFDDSVSCDDEDD